MGEEGGLRTETPPAAPRLCPALRDNETEMIVLVDRALACVDFNRLFAEALRVARRRLPVRGDPLAAVFSEMSLAAVVGRVERALRGEASIAEHLVNLGEGGTHPVEASFNASRSDAGVVEGVVILMRDVTQRRRDEDDLKRSLAERRAVIEALPDAITTLRRDGTITDFKAEAAIPTPMGRDALLGRNLRTFVHVPAERILGYLAEAFETRRTVTFEYEAQVDGVPRAREGRIRAIHDDEALLLVRDVTEQRDVMSRLLVADRMASIGMLAAGVAHELNNPLAYVTSNLHVLREEIADLGRHDLLDLVRIAERGTEQMRHIVRDLKAFTRQGGAEPSCIDATKVVRRAIALAEHTIRSAADLNVTLATTLPVAMNEVRLGQVLVNLLVNAAQAFEGAAPGRSRRIEVRGFTRADRVVIEVEDTGIGIPKENLPRIFEPFFTTKDVGGTGLGLSISRDIVRAAGGELVAECPTGQGSVFRVTLPMATASTAAPAEKAAPPRPRILLVDDQELVRAGLGALLRRFADVESAASGEEALAICARGETFDLVLCDYWMPDLSGVETLARIQAMQPEQRMALMSGAELSEVDRARVAREGWAFIEKPFTREEVAGLLELESPHAQA